VTQVSNIRMANGELIPDDWFENDMGPSAKMDKMEPDGFSDRLIERSGRRCPEGRGAHLRPIFVTPEAVDKIDQPSILVARITALVPVVKVVKDFA
jgi:hypothetical protein